jgi:hypothetical protein
MTVMFFWVVMPCRLVVDINILEKYTGSVSKAEDGNSIFL